MLDFKIRTQKKWMDCKLTGFFEELVRLSLILASFDGHQGLLSGRTAEDAAVDVPKVAIADDLLKVDRVSRQLIVGHLKENQSKDFRGEIPVKQQQK